MTTSTFVTPASELAALVAWEPCAEGCPEEFGASLCHRCGWPLDDHGARDEILAARAA